MQNIRKYFRALRFSLKYAFLYTPWKMVILFFISIFRGITPYLSSFLLGSLVNIIVYGVKNGTKDTWYILILYALVSALPSILGNILSYIQRLRMLIFQMEMDLLFLRKREELDIATHENPDFQNLMQRAFGSTNIGSIFQLTNSQFDVVTSLSSLILGTILAIHFNIWVYIAIISSAMPAFITDIRYAGFGWSIWAKVSPEQRKLNDLREHIRYKIPLIETKLLQAGQRFLNQIREIFSDFADKQRNLEKTGYFIPPLQILLRLLGLHLVCGLFLKMLLKVNTRWEHWFI